MTKHNTNRGFSYDTLSSELLRSVRSKRSARDLSRRLGYKSNIVSRWESGECWPTAAMFLEVCQRTGIDIAKVFTKFYGRRPGWIANKPASSETVVAFLKDLRGKVPVRTLARSVDTNRYTVARWFDGTVELRLPDFLQLVEASSHRVLDLVGALVDPMTISCAKGDWLKLQRAKETAYENPWSHAVLHALELNDFGRNKGRSIAGLAARLGIGEDLVTASLDVLKRAGQVRKHKGFWRVEKVSTVDTGDDQRRSRKLKAFWGQVAQDRLLADAPGLFGYSLFAISEKDLRQLRDIQLEYVSRMQSVISSSRRGQRVGLYCIQLLDLAVNDDSVFRR